MPVIGPLLTIAKDGDTSNVVDIRRALSDGFTIALIGETAQTGLVTPQLQVTDALEPTDSAANWYNLQSAIGTDYTLPANGKAFNYGQAFTPFTGIRIKATSGTATAAAVSWRTMKQLLHTLSEPIC